MSNKKIQRRQFIGNISLGTIGISAFAGFSSFGNVTTNTANSGLAILGGVPVAKNKVWPSWPYVDDKVVNKIVEVTKSGKWCRLDNFTEGTVATFEKEFAKMIGTKSCVATGSGTQALNTVVEALGIGPGDEVITSPLYRYGHHCLDTCQQSFTGFSRFGHRVFPA